MGGMGEWILANWFTGLSALGIIGSLAFTAVSFRSETKTRRIANLLTLTQNHRELWSELFDHPDLSRVLDASVDLSAHPISLDESFFVNMAIQHLSSAYEALQSGLVIKPEGMSQDIRWFFSLPIPKAIWEKLKVLQNDDFTEFVEQCRRGAGTGR
jgi:hypothetical protein